MINRLLPLLHVLMAGHSDPRQRFRETPAEQLDLFAERAYQAAFYSAYERHRRGQCTEMVLRMDRETLWRAATGLPPSREPQEPSEDLSWLLEPAEDILSELRAAEGLQGVLGDVSLQALHDQLAEALAVVRQEAQRRGLVRPVVGVVSP